MKKMKVLLLAVGGVIATAAIAMFAMGAVYQATSANTTYYYSQIHNDSVEEITPHGGMNYQYKLRAYTAAGEEHDMTLDTSHVLRDGAYIRIETAPIRGAVSWAEMLYDELPAAVQEKYSK